MSAFLDGYLNYIVSLANSTDDMLAELVDERNTFIQIDDVKYDDAVDGVIDNLVGMAQTLEGQEIAQESVKLAEDAAAVAAIWSFGLSMAAFVPLAATDVALGVLIKKAENDLNVALSNADKDIAAKIGGTVGHFIELFTGKSKTFFQTQGAIGTTIQDARAYVYNFFDYVSRNGGLGVANVRKYVGVARLTKDDPHLADVRDALDKLQMSDKTKDDVASCVKAIQSSKIDVTYLSFIRNFSYGIFTYKMGVSSAEIKAVVGASDIPLEEAESSVFENMDALGKVMAGVTIAISIVDAFLNVYNIVETVKRYKQTKSMLEDARKQYKDFYGHLIAGAQQYQDQQTKSTAPAAQPGNNPNRRCVML